MYRVLFFWFLLSSTAAASIIDSDIWINEFHYDNVGADSNEFVEVVVPVSLTDLSDVTLTLYNGSSGSAYDGPTSLDSFALGETASGFVFYSLEVTMQNGAPDGLALARQGDVLQFLSYEGVFTAADGVAQGLVSTDVGVQETTSTPLGSSLQLAGVGDSYFDFHWQLPLAETVGGLNQNQSVVPEPASWALWLVAASGLFWLSRRRRRQRGVL